MAEQEQAVIFKVKLEAIAQTAHDEKERNDFIKEIDGITKLFNRFLRNKKRVIDWEKIKPPQSEMVISYNQINQCPSVKMEELGKKLVVLKLNGGLGTTMGCTGPKSAIEVRNDLTFLDLTVQQIKVILSLFFLFYFFFLSFFYLFFIFFFCYFF